jgi:hypothetical protein
MNRYGCFSLTGHGIVPDGQVEGFRKRAAVSSRNEPVTTWYVFDSDDAGRIVARHETEHEAKLDVFRSNATERRWEKEQEIAARNGRP